jgi:hypothetical protein
VVVELRDIDCEVLGVTWKQRTLEGAVEEHDGLALTKLRPKRHGVEA